MDMPPSSAGADPTTATGLDDRERTVDQLIRRMNRDDDLEVRKTAARQLADTGAPRALTALVAALKDPYSAELSREQAAALATMGEPGVLALLTLRWDEGTKTYAIEALRTLDDPRARHAVADFDARRRLYARLQLAIPGSNEAADIQARIAALGPDGPPKPAVPAATPPAKSSAGPAAFDSSTLPQRAYHSLRRSLLLACLILIEFIVCGFAIGGALALFVGAVGHTDQMPVSPSALWLWCLVPALAFIVAGLVMLVVAALVGETIVLRLTKARHIDHQNRQVFRDVCEEIAIAAGVTRPRVLLLSDPSLNSMVAGSAKRATIVATTGLIDKLSRAELQAVAAHQIAHVVNGDLGFETFLAAIASVMARVTGTSELPPHARRGARVTTAPPTQVPIAVGILWFPAALFQAIINATGRAAWTERDYAADDTAVRICADPTSLVKAVRAMSTGPAGQLYRWPTIGRLFIVDPAEMAAQGRPTQPRVHDRIARLVPLLREGD